jgi:acyl-CoA dehydrogenase
VPGSRTDVRGLGGDFRCAVIVAEEFARTAHTGLAAGLHSDVVVPYIDTFGSEALKRRYLPRCVSGQCITAIDMTEPMRQTAGHDVNCLSRAGLLDLMGKKDIDLNNH